MRQIRLLILATVAGLVLALVVPAMAQTVPNRLDVPRLAIVARGDNPVDALASAPVAGAAGGIVVLTESTALVDQARNALIAFDPDVVILAGGDQALSKAVFDAVDAAGDWETRRVSGLSRYDTAEALAAVLSEYGLDGLDISDAVPAEDRTTYVQAGASVTDNGQALLDAIASIPTLGPGGTWTVRLASGIYDLGTKQLVLPAGVTMRGAGTTSVIRSERSASGPTSAAAVVVTDAGNILEDLSVQNRSPESDSVVGVYATSYITVRRVDLGQNTNGVGDGASYGLVVDGSFAVEDSSLTGFATASRRGVGLLARTGFGGQIVDSTLATQSDATGAGLVIESGFSGDVEIRRTLFRGFATGQGFIQNSTKRLDIAFSEFTQDGIDGTVTGGTVTIGSSMRDKTITEAGGTATCIYNFTSAMAAIGC